LPAGAALSAPDAAIGAATQDAATTNVRRIFGFMFLV